MGELEPTLISFLQTLEKATLERALKHRKLQEFWRNSFQSYMGRMKFPKHIDDHPRRYFHLHAMRYILQKTNPQIVWNLCVGNSKPTIPVLEKFIEVSQTTTKTCYWINIDFVPELKQYNEKVIKNQFKFFKNDSFGSLSVLEGEKIKILNITGSLEDFFELYIQTLGKVQNIQQDLFCLDGIANVSIEPEDWLDWWKTVINMIVINFKAWYFTWLLPASLNVKFDFYYNVVLQKHQIPLNWIELLVLENQWIGDDYTIWKQVTFTKFNQKALFELTSTQMDDKKDVLCRFFTDESKRFMVYQALYITEESLRKITNKQALGYIGHKEIDSILFNSTNDLYLNNGQNFVKSIPYMGFQEKIKK